MTQFIRGEGVGWDGEPPSLPGPAGRRGRLDIRANWRFLPGRWAGRSGLCIYGPIPKGRLWGCGVCENRRFQVVLRGVQSY